VESEGEALNVDRPPDDGGADPERATETPQLTELAAEAPPPPEPSLPKEDPPATEKSQSTENTVQADDSPETPDTAAPPPDPAEARETAEPRSRQEHADQPPPPDTSRPSGQVDRTNQEEALPAKETPAETEDSAESDDIPASPHDHPPAESEDSNTQEELPGAAGSKPNPHTEYGEVSPQETPPGKTADPQPTQESTAKEESNQKDIENDLNAEKATDEDADASGSDPRDQEAAKLDNHTGRADDGSRPLTVPEHEERISDVEDRLVKAHAADLASDHQHTTDPDRQQWTAERDRIHGEIVRDIYSEASSVPCEYRAIIAGGLGGAGKSTVLSAQLGIDRSQFLTINPDDIKEKIARRGLVPEIEGLSPMEASDLVHEESSIIAKQLAHRAQLDGKNLIWDITMSSQKSTQDRIDDLRSAGYSRIDAVFVDIPIETSIRRTQARHHEGHDKWRAGEGLGGRYVPPEVILRQADPDWGSKNRKYFEAAKATVNNWIMLDNSVDDHHAVVVESSKPKNVSHDSPEEWAL
jgi:predicted ABC-type ATPase